MGFEPGNTLSTGRPRGVPNKLTTTIREAVLEAFSELQKDPNNNLLAWGKQNPSLFYQIASKLIPTEINHSLDNKVIRVITPGKPDEITDAEVLP
jgi:hypothetical protein